MRGMFVLDVVCQAEGQVNICLQPRCSKHLHVLVAFLTYEKISNKTNMR